MPLAPPSALPFAQPLSPVAETQPALPGARVSLPLMGSRRNTVIEPPPRLET